MLAKSSKTPQALTKQEAEASSVAETYANKALTSVNTVLQDLLACCRNKRSNEVQINTKFFTPKMLEDFLMSFAISELRVSDVYGHLLLCTSNNSTGLGFFFFFFFFFFYQPSCVLSANRVNCGYFCFIIPILPPPPGSKILKIGSRAGRQQTCSVPLRL